MLRPSDTESQRDYFARVVEWRSSRDGGNRLFWPLFWISVPCIIAARILQDRLTWIWFPAAAPMTLAFVLYGLYRRRLNKLAEKLGLICWNCGNIAAESENYRLITDPEKVVREGRCLWCFRKVDERGP